MFETIRHKLLSHGPLTGEILSIEGDIYIARLIDEKGNIVETCKNRFSSLVNAKDWSRQHGVDSFVLRHSTAYFEMINN